MRIVPTIAMLALLSATGWIPGTHSACLAEPSEPSREQQQEVRRLIEDLAGATRDQRVIAEKRLLELGPPILPLLPPPDLLPSNSVREAVRRIRVDLERRQARESVMPSHVTLTGTRPLAEVLHEISQQTGNLLDGKSLPAPLLEQPIELNFTATPFWRVVDELSERYKFRHEYDVGLHGLKLLPQVGGFPGFAGAVGYAGAFRIEALPVARLQRPGGRVGQNGFALPRDLLRATLRMRAEPRLRPLFVQFNANEISLRAAGKRELTPLSTDASYDLSLAEGGNAAPIQLDYVLPDSRELGKLSLKGKMRCTTAAGNETFRFSGVTANDQQQSTVSRRRGGATVSLLRVLRDKRELRVQIAVAYEAGGPAFESHRSWFLHNEAYLEDAAGQILRLNGGSEVVQQGDGRLAIEYRFLNLPEPAPEYSFVYIAPTLIVDVPVEFEIESVPVRPGLK